MPPVFDSGGMRGRLRAALRRQDPDLAARVEERLADPDAPKTWEQDEAANGPLDWQYMACDAGAYDAAADRQDPDGPCEACAALDGHIFIGLDERFKVLPNFDENRRCTKVCACRAIPAPPRRNVG